MDFVLKNSNILFSSNISPYRFCRINYYSVFPFRHCKIHYLFVPMFALHLLDFLKIFLKRICNCSNSLVFKRNNPCIFAININNTFPYRVCLSISYLLNQHSKCCPYRMNSINWFV